jgi:hypothetical protein
MDPLKTSIPILYSVTPAMYMAMFRLSDGLYILETSLNELATWRPRDGIYICQVLERDAMVQDNCDPENLSRKTVSMIPFSPRFVTSSGNM